MVIQCPLNYRNREYAEELIGLGADEFYLGYSAGFKYSTEVTNRRQGSLENFPTLESTRETVARINGRGKKVFFTLNEHFYPLDYLERILDDVGKAADFGVGGFIVSDINLVLMIEERYPDTYLIASTGFHVLNSEAARHAREMGIGRIILPRHLRTGEIRQIMANSPGIDFEVFAKNQDCCNIDGLCSYMHGTIAGYPFDQACRRLQVPESLWERYKPDTFACGACGLFDLAGVGELSLKIVGRDQSIEQCKNDVSFFVRILQLLPRCGAKEEYERHCVETYLSIYGHPCGFRCYR